MIRNAAGSSKAMGRHEEVLMKRLGAHYSALGYEVYTHVRLNIAWSNGLSDVDVLLYKDGQLTIVEIKSKHDKFDALNDQFKRMSDYVDFFYLATEKNIPDSTPPEMGLIFIDDQVTEVKPASKLMNKPRKSSLYALKKICLMNMLNGGHKNLLKSEIVDTILTHMDAQIIKSMIKDVAVCNNDIHINCPLFYYISAKQTKAAIQLERFLD